MKFERVLSRSLCFSAGCNKRKNALDILKIIAALVNIAFGLYSIVQPERLATASGFRLTSPRGRAELRVAFGGFYIGFGIAALILNDPAAYRLLGIGYLCAAGTRLLQIAMESPAIVTRAFLILGLIEFTIGLILVL